MKYMIMMFGEVSTLWETKSPEWLSEMQAFMMRKDQELREAGEHVDGQGLADVSTAKTIVIKDVEGRLGAIAVCDTDAFGRRLSQGQRAMLNSIAASAAAAGHSQIRRRERDAEQPGYDRLSNSLCLRCGGHGPVCHRAEHVQMEFHRFLTHAVFGRRVGGDHDSVRSRGNLRPGSRHGFAWSHRRTA